MKYQRNNILFRISSATAISKFKSIQASSFFQINKPEFSFCECTKEAVLLSYEIFSNWIFRVEKICKSAINNSENNELISTLYSSFLHEMYSMQTIIDSNADIFNKDISQFIKEINDYSEDLILAYFNTLKDSPIDEVYINIVDFITRYLQHFMVSMHEFNNNIVKKDPAFISVLDFCIDKQLSTSDYLKPCITRLKFFINFGINNFTLKYYGAHTESYNIFFDALCKYIKTLNINININKEQL